MSTAQSLFDSDHFGTLLKAWRSARKLSQLELSLEAGVSQRHISFLESGRATPSREMILQLAETLQVPLREQNRLLNAAGFSALYRQRSLDDADMIAVRQALDLTLAHHEPFPALVMDRCWNLVRGNDAATAMLGLMGDTDTMWQAVDPGGSMNIMRLSFHPAGMQPLLRNWEAAATHLLCRLQREVADDPTNTGLREVFEEVRGYPGIPRNWESVVWTQPPPPILALELASGDLQLNIFSMLSTFGTAQDITAAELRIESFFPRDDATADFFRALVAA